MSSWTYDGSKCSKCMHQPIPTHHPLRGKRQTLRVASGEHSDNVATFKSDAWKHFGSLMSRNCRTRTYTRLIAYCSIEKVQSLLNKRWLHFFPSLFFLISQKSRPCYRGIIVPCDCGYRYIPNISLRTSSQCIYLGGFFVVVVFPFGARPLAKGQRTVSLPLIPSGGFSCASSVTSNSFCTVGVL